LVPHCRCAHVPTCRFADVDAAALFYALADTVAEVQANKLYNTSSDMKAETLVEPLDDTLAKNKGRDTW